jgi:hypothetical protein
VPHHSINRNRRLAQPIIGRAPRTPATFPHEQEGRGGGCGQPIEFEPKIPVKAPDSHNNSCFTLLAHLAHQKQPKVDKTPDGTYDNGFSYHGYQEISKSTGLASDFQNCLLFSLFSGNLGPPVFGRLAVRVPVQP